jgi:CrcB protein
MHFGAHLHSHFPFRPIRHAMTIQTKRILSAICLLLWLAVLLTFVLSPYSWRTGRRVSLSLVIAPPATWLRWWLAAYLNPRSPQWIKWGTWGSNMLSTCVLSTAVLLQYTLPTAKASLIQCQALQALQDGFSGCLSTIPVRRLAKGPRLSRVAADSHPLPFPYASGLPRACRGHGPA